MTLTLLNPLGPWRSRSVAATLWLFGSVFALPTLGSVGCGPAEIVRTDEKWSLASAELEIALLSVSGTAEDDVWMVGADAGRGGVVVHFDGKEWTRQEVGQPFDLWWVQALAKDRVFVSGAGATVLEWDGTTWLRHATPGHAADTVFGLWAASADDVWAVGGRAGRAGFLWHFDGAAWQNVDLPDDVPRGADGELPAVFKVWGRSADDVYAVGNHGLLMHFDGTNWTVIPTDVDDILFTVHGDADEVLIVGGDNNAVVLDAKGKNVGPESAPFFQGAVLAPDGTAWATGAQGVVYARPKGGEWAEVSTDLEQKPASLHAVWVDPSGGVWSVGGNVLSSALDRGIVFKRGSVVPEIARVDLPEPPEPKCPEGRVDLAPDGSIARRWNELLLDSIRRDIPKPGVHARNLFHFSAAVYDAWAVYDASAEGLISKQKLVEADVAEARLQAISYAAYRVLRHRYEPSINGPTSIACYDAFMSELGLDASDEHATGDDPIAVGNRVGNAIVAAFAEDGANEQNGYADTTSYEPVNPPLVVDRPGTPATEPDLWQELNLAQAETQNSIVVESGVQGYIGPNWGFVTPFALPPDVDGDGVHLDVEFVPTIEQPEMADWVAEMISTSADLDPESSVTIDISPGAYGNNPLGTNLGVGHAVNPTTGLPYQPNVVKRGDFTRVLAEFWADGPKSETPPGHWNVLANEVSDQTEELAPFGSGPAVDRLEWDTKLYLTLNGALHDAAIVAWGIKRKYTTARPITLVRHMAELGQRSDPDAASYHPGGLPLVPGLVELVTEASAKPGERHHALRFWVGSVVVKSWLGEPGDRKNEVGGVGWIRAVDWIPYQRRTFVTPAFPGLVSGHSTFSRAAAEVLTEFTASAFFPAGFGEFVAKKNEYLVFEDGPSEEVRLQWATYYDAADQAGQSRIWGGIHISADDGQGRKLGSEVGLDAGERARALFGGTSD